MLYGGVCWVLMLELGGLADARPIHIKTIYTIVSITMAQCGPNLRYFTTVYLGT